MNNGKSVTGIEIACCLGLTDSQALHYPAPIARHPSVSRVLLLRSRRSPFGQAEGTEYIITSRFLPLRLLQMYRHCVRLARREEVRGFVSFNPYPYGLIPFFAARRFGKAIHFGFIGPDWYWHMKSVRRRFLLKYVRRADFITATGEGMRQDIIAAGVDPAKVSILPHCIDVERFTVNNPDTAAYDCVYVGKLIRRKRVDVLLRAFARVLETHPASRFCVVGDGPLRTSLSRLADDIGLASAVDFVGYRQDVEHYLSNARTNVMSSSQEGFPFSLVEGMCCGSVPISTPVGTIGDLITDGENGLLFPEEDVEGLAACITRLLDDRPFYDRLRDKVLQMRDDFSYDRATAVWDSWLRTLAG